MALAHAKGELALGVEHISEGILGTRFHGHLEREVSIGRHRAVVPVVTGEAYLTGRLEVLLDPRDPFPCGFLLDAPCVPRPPEPMALSEQSARLHRRAPAVLCS
ncbi:MAG: proline racemase family protein, partial [Cyanobacteriota bacterium]